MGNKLRLPVTRAFRMALFACISSACLAGSAVSFLSVTNYGANAGTSVVVADFNNDGKPDLAVAGDNCAVSVLLGTGNGGFGSATNYNLGLFNGTATGLAAADFASRGGKPKVQPI